MKLIKKPLNQESVSWKYTLIVNCFQQVFNLETDVVEVC